MAETPSKSNEPIPALSSPDRAGAKTQPEPQRTDLEVFLRYHLPNFFKKNVDRILLGLVVVAAVFLFFNWRNRSAQVEQYNVEQSGAMAWEALEMGRSVFSSSSGLPQTVRERMERAEQIETFVNTVLTAGSSSPELKAKVLLVRGDLNFMLGRLPASAWVGVPTGATTRPAADYLSSAQQAYEQILRDYANQKAQAIPALFGMAAIAETRRDFAGATRHYDMILASDAARPWQKAMAGERKGILPQLAVDLAPPPAATQPASVAGTGASAPTIQPGGTPPATATTATAPASAPAP